MSGFQFDAELAVLLCVFLGLCYGFTVLRPIAPSPRFTAAKPHLPPDGHVESAASAAGYPRFAFAGPNAAQAIIAPAPRPATPAASTPPPTTSGMETASVESHALLADPAFDPLGAVLVSGLPDGFHLSAGTQLSPSDWALAFGDLDNLVIRLPEQRQTPLRTTLDLRTRSGARIHTFTVELQQDGPTNPESAVAPNPSESVAKPRNATSKAGRSLRKAARKPRTADAPSALPPQKSAPKPAPKTAAASATTPPKPAAANTSPDAAKASSAAGLFKPDPKDSALTGLTTSERDDPRFTILRGLGMRPPDE